MLGFNYSPQVDTIARLASLGIDSLEVRRLKAALIMYYKILHNFIDVDSKMFSSLVNNSVTRGHPIKIINLTVTQIVNLIISIVEQSMCGIVLMLMLLCLIV